MHPNIEKLYNIACKPERLILGLMSGTSLDGLDIALCRFSGAGIHAKFELLHFTTIPYSSSFQDKIRLVFAKETVEQRHISGLNVLIANQHAEAVLKALKIWGYTADDVDLLASHGQTIYHEPNATAEFLYPNHTFQIGDGDHLAVKTGIITVSDFRQKHVAAGGEGAPLAIYGDYLMFSSEQENRVLLNLGGISNFTYLPSVQSLNDGKEVWATDLGPANTLINQYVHACFGMEMDEDGKIASKGTIQPDLLRELMNHPFFKQEFPKTTGPELFNLAFINKALESCGQTFGHEDVVATLTAFTVECVKMGLDKLNADFTLYVSGGGLHNPVLMRGLASLNPVWKVEDFSKLGVLADAKEALLFAALANESVAGNNQSLKALKNVPQVAFGKISFPN